MISHLGQDQIELDLAEKEKEVEESEKNILNYQQTIRVSFSIGIWFDWFCYNWFRAGRCWRNIIFDFELQVLIARQEHLAIDPLAEKKPKEAEYPQDVK